MVRWAWTSSRLPTVKHGLSCDNLHRGAPHCVHAQAVWRERVFALFKSKSPLVLLTDRLRGHGQFSCRHPGKEVSSNEQSHDSRTAHSAETILVKTTILLACGRHVFFVSCPCLFSLVRNSRFLEHRFTQPIFRIKKKTFPRNTDDATIS